MRTSSASTVSTSITSLKRYFSGSSALQVVLLQCDWSNTASAAHALQFHLPFYQQYLAKWPEYCLTAEGPSDEVMGYIFGKAEGEGSHWHGHVTAVTVAPESR